MFFFDIFIYYFMFLYNNLIILFLYIKRIKHVKTHKNLKKINEYTKKIWYNHIK
jgi:hypothetical protein